MLSQPDDDSWTGERGYVQVVKNVFLYKERVISLVYVCSHTIAFAGCIL